MPQQKLLTLFKELRIFGVSLDLLVCLRPELLARVGEVDRSVTRGREKLSLGRYVWSPPFRLEAVANHAQPEQAASLRLGIVVILALLG